VEWHADSLYVFRNSDTNGHELLDGNGYADSDVHDNRDPFGQGDSNEYGDGKQKWQWNDVGNAYDDSFSLGNIKCDGVRNDNCFVHGDSDGNGYENRYDES
jgi:hypothetical protein